MGQTVVIVNSTSACPSSRKYVNASYVDGPVMLVDRTAAGSVGAGTDERFYYHRNQQYSITTLCDNSGAVVEQYAYTAYGEPTILDGAGMTPRTSSAYGNPYLYTARAYDSESGVYYFRARMYEGRKGRFLSHDPIEYPDGNNTYAGWFAISSRDPSGEVVDSQLCEDTFPFPEPVPGDFTDKEEFKDIMDKCGKLKGAKRLACLQAAVIGSISGAAGYKEAIGKWTVKIHCCKSQERYPDPCDWGTVFNNNLKPPKRVPIPEKYHCNFEGGFFGGWTVTPRKGNCLDCCNYQACIAGIEKVGNIDLEAIADTLTDGFSHVSCQSACATGTDGEIRDLEPHTWGAK